MPARPWPVSLRLLPYAVAALVGWGGISPRGAMADGPAAAAPTESNPEVRSALDALRSPYLADREDATARLIAELPLAREAALHAFRAQVGPARIALVRVLAADGSKESLDLLLATLVETEDPALGGAIRRALAEHAEAVSKSVEGYRDAKGAVPRRIEELTDILRRAKVEALFLAKKSRSGSTGYYRGQFDSLKADRESALHILLAIFQDRSFKWPGEFPAGSYRFLRPPPFPIDRLELRDLAANAIAELMTSADTWLLAELAGYYDELEHEAEVAQRRRGRNGLGFAQMSPADALLDVVLATLARHTEPPAQGEWLARVRMRVRNLRGRELGDEAASLCLRLGWYELAIDLYQREIELGRYLAIPYYNVACAHAIWSREFEAEDPAEAAKHRKEGMENLKSSVENGYVDWPWMEQDRDLDALRGEPGYPELLQKIKAEFVLSGTSLPPPPPMPPPPMPPAMGSPPR